MVVMDIVFGAVCVVDPVLLGVCWDVPEFEGLCDTVAGAVWTDVLVTVCDPDPVFVWVSVLEGVLEGELVKDAVLEDVEVPVMVCVLDPVIV